jgi:hypothetical protein
MPATMEGEEVNRSQTVKSMEESVKINPKLYK